MTQYRADVTVSLKKGVLDPEAKTIQRSLERLGFELNELNTSEHYNILLESRSEEEALDEVNDMCEKLLANPVIHDYEIDISRAD